MKILDTLNHVLNVSSMEWPRITVAWSMIFLARIGYIVGWSVLMAIFIGKVGIELLPLLFLVNGVFIMLGSFLFKPLFRKCRLELLITITVLIAAAFLLSSLLFWNEQNWLFFLFFLIAESLLLSQVNIMISLFNEDLFSPLESQRTFPIIESAETMGGVLGGLALSLFADSVPIYKFILLWVLVLILILPIVLRFNTRTMEVPMLEEEHSKHFSKAEHKSTWQEIKKIPFLKGLMVVVALHWAMMNIVEFQYTKAIQQDVYSAQEQTLVHEVMPHGYSVELAEEELFIQETMQNYEQAIVEKMGTLHLVFNAAALLMQLIFTSRILSFLGITSTMLIHPLVTCLNLIGMTLRFNFYTASLTRGSYEITNILFKNAYDSSYYGIPHHLRSSVKEWMQGIVKPLGAMLGTVGMMLMAWFLSGPEETLVLNLVLIFVSLVAAGVALGLGRKYTHLAEQNLSHKRDLPTRLNAIEILAQKGHEIQVGPLQKLLERDNEPEILKERIIETLGIQAKKESLASLLTMLKDKNEDIRFKVAEALGHFEGLRSLDLAHSFSRYRVLTALKNRLREEENDWIRDELLRTFYHLASEEVMPFVMQELEGEKESPAFIRMLHLFPDPNLKFYLQPLLIHKNPRLKAAALLSLWQFKDMQSELKHHLKQMLTHPKDAQRIPAIQIVGRLEIQEFKPLLEQALHQGSEEVQKAALLALTQMGELKVMPTLIDRLLDPEHEWFMKSSHVLSTMSTKLRQTMEQELELRIVERIHALIKHSKQELKTAKRETLEFLKRLYYEIHAHHEAHQIQKLLDSREGKSL